MLIPLEIILAGLLIDLTPSLRNSHDLSLYPFDGVNVNVSFRDGPTVGPEYVIVPYAADGVTVVDIVYTGTVSFNTHDVVSHAVGIPCAVIHPIGVSGDTFSILVAFPVYLVSLKYVAHVIDTVFVWHVDALGAPVYIAINVMSAPFTVCVAGTHCKNLYPLFGVGGVVGAVTTLPFSAVVLVNGVAASTGLTK
jgi:hypothetical protein